MWAVSWVGRLLISSCVSKAPALVCVCVCVCVRARVCVCVVVVVRCRVEGGLQ